MAKGTEANNVPFLRLVAESFYPRKIKESTRGLHLCALNIQLTFALPAQNAAYAAATPSKKSGTYSS
jgi:hypothetical protein